MSSPLSAWALGVGQIRVLSQRDQPLLAEIPILSSDPSELEALQARLASPETFARVGLSAPQGVVSDLHFSVAVGSDGRPVIRVTSPTPVQQPLLTFLVEIDWGSGKLVREYSALIDTPQTAAAPVQPPIEEAATTASTVGDTGGTIERAPDPLPTPPTPPPQVASAPPPAVVPTPAPTPTPVETAPEPVSAATPVQIPDADRVRNEPAPTGGDSHLVQRGETLAGIASGLGRPFNLDQTIVALLRANPSAFIGGNANRLKAGSVLRIPDDAGIARYTPDEAAVVMREQVAQWRGASRTLPQPPAVAGAPAIPRSARPPGSDAHPVAGARLEITPPSAKDAKKAGTRSGVSAGGEGDMVRQQELQETRETLAARDAEVQELKARVAELEQLQKKQNELISMKDSALASAEKRLAQSQSQPPSPPAAARDAGTPLAPWLGLGGGLLVLGLGGWWWLRRRAASAAPVAPAKPAATERSRDTERLAAAIPKAGDAAPAADTAAPAPTPAPAPSPAPTAAEPAWNKLAKPAEPEPAKPASLRPRTVPTWHSGGVSVAPMNEPQTPPPAPAPAPTASTPQASLPLTPPVEAPPAASTQTAGSGNATSGQGRLDLAKAYLDLGDRDTARTLLLEVATRGDSVDVRREAERLLQELG